jgi:hypothetical protein
MIGCRAQQTCTACAEKAAEVVRNGKGGTGFGQWLARTEGEWSEGDRARAWRPERAPAHHQASAGWTPFGGSWSCPSAGSGRTQRMSMKGIFEKSMRGVRQDSPAGPRQGIGTTTSGSVGRCEGVDDALDGTHPATDLRGGRGWRHRPRNTPGRTTRRGRHSSWTKARRGRRPGTQAPVPPSVGSTKVSPLETGSAKATVGRGKGQRPAAEGRARRTTKSMGTPEGAPQTTMHRAPVPGDPPA